MSNKSNLGIGNLLDIDSIDGPTIHAHPPADILLWCEQCGYGTRTQALSNKALSSTVSSGMRAQ